MILYRLVGPFAHLSGVLLRLRSEHFRGAWEWLRGAVRRLILWPYLRSAYADEEIFLWAWSSMPSGDATSAPKGCRLAPLGLPVWRCAGMSAVEIAPSSPSAPCASECGAHGGI